MPWSFGGAWASQVCLREGEENLLPSGICWAWTQLLGLVVPSGLFWQQRGRCSSQGRARASCDGAVGVREPSASPPCGVFMP